MTDRPINPEDFIITRKRKLYRFALFANSGICSGFDEWQKQSVDIDIKADRLQKGVYEAKQRGLTNLRSMRARADQLTELFAEHSAP